MNGARAFKLSAVAIGVGLAAAACGSGSGRGTSTPSGKGGGVTTPGSAVSGKLSFVGIWSGPERKNFQAVLDGFHKKFPGVTVKYTSGGDNTPTILSTAIAGGNPPDLAAVGQPGLVKQFSARKAIKPIDFVKPTMAKNYAPSWVTLGTYSGHLYGMVFKGANKSTIWYSTTAFENAGVKPPKTWAELLAAAKTLRASGTKAYSIAGADGWTLTDLMENLYLRQAGAAKYDQLVDAQDQVDRPVGEDDAQVDGADLQRHRQHLRRHIGRAPDRFPDLGQQRLQPSAQGGDGDGGRLRGRRLYDEGQGRHRLQRVRVPVGRRLGSRGRRWRRHGRDVQGHRRQHVRS